MIKHTKNVELRLQKIESGIKKQVETSNSIIRKELLKAKKAEGIVNKSLKKAQGTIKALDRKLDFAKKAKKPLESIKITINKNKKNMLEQKTLIKVLEQFSTTLKKRQVKAGNLSKYLKSSNSKNKNPAKKLSAKPKSNPVVKKQTKSKSMAKKSPSTKSPSTKT